MGCVARPARRFHLTFCATTSSSSAEVAKVKQQGEGDLG
jgi:hypothetical protein